MTIHIAKTEADLRRCLPALLTLRPSLTAETALVRLQEQLANDQFSVAFVDLGNSADAPAAITYRIMTMLFSGKTCYIDDLSTQPEARGNGYAGALIDFVKEQAKQAGCVTLSLDSGHGPERNDAHRLYLNKGFRISSHHFSQTI
ncbi:GNAT family N-acetyltransferase [Fibrella sp. HMF5335]|uniref:GNAT family N-acetyltransferase n=1 Tax=Fibrella rubiginis TaxID=2817060 RepID=A0A939GHW5_9BACT|nr:GNAT family N-acetyltransferase [Fibrella rubiginis]MBO0938098.1 GNAT family N-acetyltransferase [Fibrella rubiginis]